MSRRLAFYKALQLGDDLATRESFGITSTSAGPLFTGTPNSSVAGVAETGPGGRYEIAVKAQLFQDTENQETTAAWQARLLAFGIASKKTIETNANNAFTFSGDLVFVSDSENEIGTLDVDHPNSGEIDLETTGGPAFWGQGEVVYIANAEEFLYEFAKVYYKSDTTGPYIRLTNTYLAGSTVARWDYRLPSAYATYPSLRPLPAGTFAGYSEEFEVTFESAEAPISNRDEFGIFTPAPIPTVPIPINPALFVAVFWPGSI